MLTEKELKEIEDLKPGFNIVQESKNYDLMSYRRVDLSRRTARTLLKLSFILNCISIACFCATLLFSFFKPLPEYYASTPSGKIYGPLEKEKMK